MKLKFVFALLFAPAVLFLSQGCEKCDVSGGTINFSADEQFLAITYLVDSNDANFCTSVYNPANVRVLFNDNGGVGRFDQLQEDLSDGKIGPFPYTTSPGLAKRGVFHDFVYIVQKDTFGLDTFNIKFYPAVDECQEYWSLIEFYMNGVLLPEGVGLEICDLQVRE